MLDSDLPDAPAMSLVSQFRNHRANVPVVVLSRRPDIAVAVRAMRAGATDFVDKATPAEELRRTVRDLLSTTPADPSVPADTTFAAVLTDYPSFFRCSEKMRAVERLVLEVAVLDAPVLIFGEPGVGKEALARVLHHLSRRRGHPLASINCTGLPESVLDSELFGEVLHGGQTKAGRVEQARGGTLMIAEISEMNAALQARAVRLLRERTYTRAHGSTLEPGDVRVIATSHKDLLELVVRGEFRADLNEAFAWRITLPPLRERREEIPGLVRAYLDRYARELGRERCELSERSLGLLLEYEWPGNIRELANVIKRRVVLDDETNLRDEVQARIKVAQTRPRRPGSGAHHGLGGKSGPDTGLRSIARQAAEEAELDAIKQVLEALNWNRAAAARRLKISYKTLLNKLNRGRLHPPPGRPGRHARK